MIRIELDPQVAVELHHGAGLLREVLEQNDRPEQALQMRDAQLALSGALRGAGWVPQGDGWAHQANRRRR